MVKRRELTLSSIVKTAPIIFTTMDISWLSNTRCTSVCSAKCSTLLISRQPYCFGRQSSYSIISFAELFAPNASSWRMMPSAQEHHLMIFDKIQRVLDVSILV